MIKKVSIFQEMKKAFHNVKGFSSVGVAGLLAQSVLVILKMS
jgi:hypothetical protein